MADRILALELGIGLQGEEELNSYLRSLTELKGSITRVREENKKLNAENRRLLKEARTGNKEAEQQYKRNARTITENEQVLRKLTSEQRQLNKQVDRLKTSSSAYKSLSKELNINRTRYKDLLATRSQGIKLTKAENAELKRLTVTVRDQDKTLKAIDAQAGQFQRNVGDYRKAFSGIGDLLTGGLITGGVVAITGGLIEGFKDASQTVLEFQQGLSQLSSITGIEGNALTDLGNRAIELSNRFGTAATDILEAYRLIVSAAPQLRDNAEGLAFVTEQAEILAKASGLTLPAAAEALTKSVNQYGLSAVEAGRVTDILATSQQRGTATVAQLSDALKNVGSVANASNIDFEQTNVLLQALAKGGLLGAEAGTKLRGILVKLAQTNREDLNPATQDFGDILNTLSTEVTDITAATEIFGVENAAAALTLIEQRDVVDELSGSLGEYGNALSQANTNTDNVSGTIDKFKASYDALILNIDSGNGIISRFSSGLIGFTGNLLDAAAAINGEDFNFGNLGDAFDPVERARAQLDRFVEQSKLATTQTEKLAASIKVNNGAVTVLEALGRKINVTEAEKLDLQQKIQALNLSSQESQNRLIVLTKAQEEATRKETEAVTENTVITEKSTQAIKKKSEERQAAAGSVKELQDQIQKLNAELNSGSPDDATLTKRLEEIASKEADLEKLQKRIEQIKGGLQFEESDFEPLNLESLQTENIAFDNTEQLKAVADEGLEIFRETEAKKKEIDIQNTDDERERRRKLAGFAIDQVQQIANASTQIERNKLERELAQQNDALTREEERRLAGAAGNAQAELAVREEFEGRREELEREAAKKRKELAVKEAIIKGALAVLAALATGNAPQAIAAGIAAATQLAVISSQEFAKGTILKGDRHSDSGSAGIPIFSRSGQMFGYAEDGEPILTRGTTQNERSKGLTSAWNVMHGGDDLGGKAAPKELVRVLKNYAMTGEIPGGVIPQTPPPPRPIFNVQTMPTLSEAKQVFIDYDKMGEAFAKSVEDLSLETDYNKMGEAFAKSVEDLKLEVDPTNIVDAANKLARLKKRARS